MEFILSLLIWLEIPISHAEGLNGMVIVNETFRYVSETGRKSSAKAAYNYTDKVIEIYKRGDTKEFIEELGHHVCLSRELPEIFGKGDSFANLSKNTKEWTNIQEDCSVTYRKFYNKEDCHGKAIVNVRSRSDTLFKKCMIIRKWHQADIRKSLTLQP